MNIIAKTVKLGYFIANFFLRFFDTKINFLALLFATLELLDLGTELTPTPRGGGCAYMICVRNLTLD